MGAWLLQPPREAQAPEPPAFQVFLVRRAPELTRTPPFRARTPRLTPAVTTPGPVVAKVPLPAVPGEAAPDLTRPVFAQGRQRSAVRPAIDCLEDPDRLTPARRERCRQIPEALAEARIVLNSKAREAELDYDSGRKAAIILYRDNLWAPYPGLNCVFRGKKCPD